MKIGIDFGTSYTKIAYLTTEGDLCLFGFKGNSYIATKIAYEQQPLPAPVIGNDAIVKYSESEISFYQNFKLFLSPENQEDRDTKWQGEKSPDEVTRDYLHNLLISDPHSFEKSVGIIDQVVISVPKHWDENINHPGLKSLLDIYKTLNISVNRYYSDPVCAAAYFAYQNRHTANEYNLLVFDVGGMSLTLALCQIKPNQIKVLEYCDSLQQGFDIAGVAFDRACVTATLNAQENGEKLQLNSKEYNRSLFEFEKVKLINKGDAAKFIDECHSDKYISDTEVYKTEQNTITVSQAYQAFSLIIEKEKNLLKDFLDKCRQNNLTIDQTMITGGFGQYLLVRNAIEKFLQSNRIPINPGNRLCDPYAVAYGAALLANEQIQVIEPYQHTISICTWQRSYGKLGRDDLPIILAGKTRAGMLCPQYVTKVDGSPEIIQVDNNNNNKLPIYIRFNGKENLFTNINVSPIEYPRPGNYKIGFQIDRFNRITLVFEDIEDGSQKYYTLENKDSAINEDLK